MKIRRGFVSNSSSSSFICDITGEEVQGYDMGVREAGMYGCENGHYFLEEFLIGELPDDEESGGYEIPEENCPICSFNHIMESNIVLYIEKQYGILSSEVFDYMKSKSKRLRKVRPVYWFELLEKTKNVSKVDVEEEIKKRFKNLEDFENFLRK